MLALAIAILTQTITIPPATPVAKALEPLVEVSRLDEMRWPDFTAYRTHLRNFSAARLRAGMAGERAADGAGDGGDRDPRRGRHEGDQRRRLRLHALAGAHP